MLQPLFSSAILRKTHKTKVSTKPSFLAHQTGRSLLNVPAKFRLSLYDAIKLAQIGFVLYLFPP